MALAASVQELFEAQVERTPDAVAVRFAQTQLTYKDLDNRANQLAHALIELGVGPEVLVGVHLTRCPELMVALLGILKAGGAYLPLDPEYPEARLSFMLADAEVRFLLTHRRLLGQMPSHEAKVVCLDSDEWAGVNRSVVRPFCRGRADSLVYVMYTSGSTGRPKGVLVTHGGLVNYLGWCRAAYPLDAGNGSPVHSSVAFDLSVTSLFVPLIAGQTVHLLPQGNAIDLLRDAFRSPVNFSLVKITPAHLELLAQVLQPHEAAGRTQAFVIGGENLTARHLAFWQEFAPQTLLVNEYGPTETVVGCCVYFLPPGKSGPGSVPIGRPIANTTLHVLDSAMQPVGPAAVGQLYIGGAGVARGYLNRPDLTAECFVPDPFSGQPGARLYRSGDLVRKLADGNLEFLGRADGQVKVNGFRIETEEVEGALQGHPAVVQAIVQAREDVAGGKRLVAYVVLRAEQSLTAVAMRAYLRDQLPDFMVPADLVVLREFPLTPNGKVDVRGLPAPTRVAHSQAVRPVPTGDLLTDQMVRIWEEVLGIRPVGLRDNFFDLGGDSILTVRLFSRIRKVFGRDLPLATLLVAPDVERLMPLLDNFEPQGVVSLVPLREMGAKQPFFCLPGADGDVLQLSELARHLEPGQPFYALQPHLPTDMTAQPSSVEELAACYLRVIRSAQPRGPYFLGGFSFGGTLAFEMAQQLVASGETVALLAVLDHQACSTRAGRRPAASCWQILLNLPGWVYRDLGPKLAPKLLERAGTLAAAVLRRAVGCCRTRRNPEQRVAEAEVGDVRQRLHEYHVRLQAGYSARPTSVPVTLLRGTAQRQRRLTEAFFLGHDLG